MNNIKRACIALLLAFFSACALGGGEEKVGLPRYVGEFLGKLNIPLELIDDPTFLNKSVPAAAAKVGFENIQKAAHQAKDSLTNGAYFKVEVIEGGFVIERHYALIKEIREVRLYLFTDASGKFVRAGYTEGIRK